MDREEDLATAGERGKASRCTRAGCAMICLFCAFRAFARAAVARMGMVTDLASMAGRGVKCGRTSGERRGMWDIMYFVLMSYFT